MERRKLKIAPTLLALFIVGNCVYGVYDAHTSFHWTSFWQDCAHKSPGAYRPQLNCSNDFLEKGEYAFALAYAERAILLRPERASGWINASTAAAGLKAYHLSYECLQRAFAIYPARQLAENLIHVCRVLGKETEAAELTAKLPTLDPGLKLKEPTQ